MVGGLIYLMHSRPYIAFSVGAISRVIQKPSILHNGTAKRILRYFTGTLQYGILYRKVDQFMLREYANSDYASSLDDRKSISVIQVISES